MSTAIAWTDAHPMLALMAFFSFWLVVLLVLAKFSHETDPTDAAADAVEMYRRREREKANAQNEAMRRAWRLDGTRMASNDVARVTRVGVADERAPERAARIEAHHTPMRRMDDDEHVTHLGIG